MKAPPKSGRGASPRRREPILPSHPRICYVAHGAYGALVGNGQGKIGGAEQLAAVHARWFAAKGYDVHMITWDEGQPDGQEVHGVKVHRICRENAGLPGMRFLVPKWSSLIRTLGRIDPDICHQSMGGCATGQVGLWCRAHGRRFIHSVVSDPDCDPKLPIIPVRRERILYKLGLKLASRTIVQTRRQQRMLAEGFGLDSVVVPMPCAGPEAGEYRPPHPPEPGEASVLWLARLCEIKRPHLLLDVAEACPETAFHLVGPISDEACVRPVLERAGKIPNVVVHGRVPREEVLRFLADSACLLCTSELEGFPNTFLEAWSHGLPVVTTFDPDDLVRTHELGVVGQSARELAAGLSRLLADADLWRRCSDNARRYYLENHRVDDVMRRHEALFLEVAGRGRDGGDDA